MWQEPVCIRVYCASLNIVQLFPTYVRAVFRAIRHKTVCFEGVRSHPLKTNCTQRACKVLYVPWKSSRRVDYGSIPGLNRADAKGTCALGYGY